MKLKLDLCCNCSHVLPGHYKWCPSIKVRCKASFQELEAMKLEQEYKRKIALSTNQLNQ